MISPRDRTCSFFDRNERFPRPIWVPISLSGRVVLAPSWLNCEIHFPVELPVEDSHALSTELAWLRRLFYLEDADLIVLVLQNKGVTLYHTSFGVFISALGRHDIVSFRAGVFLHKQHEKALACATFIMITLLWKLFKCLSNTYHCLDSRLNEIYVIHYRFLLSGFSRCWTGVCE